MEDQNQEIITTIEKVEKVELGEIDKLRKDIEKNISNIIKETKFYSELYDNIKRYILFDNDLILNVYGPPGTGKTKTVLQVLNELKKEINFKMYVFSSKRYEFENDFNYDFESSVILFDDCFISKRALNRILYLLSKKNRVITISNNVTDFSRNLQVRGKNFYIKLSLSDLLYIQRKLSEIYNITYPKPVFNLRELVNYTIALLTNQDYKTTFDQIIENIKNTKNIDEAIQIIVTNLKQYLNDDNTREIIQNLLIQAKNYSKTYIEKKVTKSFINLFI